MSLSFEEIAFEIASDLREQGFDNDVVYESVYSAMLPLTGDQQEADHLAQEAEKLTDPDREEEL